MGKSGTINHRGKWLGISVLSLASVLVSNVSRADFWFPIQGTLTAGGQSVAVTEKLFQSYMTPASKKFVPGYGSFFERNAVNENDPGVDCMLSLKEWAQALATRYPVAVVGKKVTLTVYDDRKGLCPENETNNQACGAHMKRNHDYVLDGSDATFIAKIDSGGVCHTPDWQVTVGRLDKFNRLRASVSKAERPDAIQVSNLSEKPSAAGEPSVAVPGSSDTNVEVVVAPK